MASPLLETKLYIPKLRRNLVARPRLRERLGRGAEAKLTLISAPAGFGKTTLLAEWLADAARDHRPIAWLSLDESDRQATSFWTYVVTALNNAMPGVGSAALQLLRSARPLSRPRSPPSSTNSARCRQSSPWCWTTITLSTTSKSRRA